MIVQMETVTFGNWLQRQLMRREMTAAELARTTGYSPGAVSKWRNNTRIPDWAACVEIADALDLPVEHVLAATGRGEGSEDAGREVEDRLVATFRRLSDEGREAVLQFVEFQRGRER